SVDPLVKEPTVCMHRQIVGGMLRGQTSAEAISPSSTAVMRGGSGVVEKGRRHIVKRRTGRVHVAVHRFVLLTHLESLSILYNCMQCYSCVIVHTCIIVESLQLHHIIRPRCVALCPFRHTFLSLRPLM